MASNSNFTRLDTIQLKDLIFLKIGHQKAQEYFNLLKRFLGEKLSKAEFDKSCVLTIGRENLPIHNRLIRAIVQNACRAKTPPPRARMVVYPITNKLPNSSKKSSTQSLNSYQMSCTQSPNGYQMSCMQSLYGDVFHQSPRKCRSPVFRDWKLQERRSPLGPLGKSPSTITCATELHSLSSRLPTVEDGEEVEQLSRKPPIWSHITAPPGLSLNTSDSRKAHHFTKNMDHTCQNSGHLPNTRSLMSRLEKNLAQEGVGISLDCANLVNNSLDAFVKRLIEPCIAISGSLSTNVSTIGNMKNQSTSGQFAQVSLMDSRVAMESNPRLLGGDWPILLEKICNSASEN